MPYKLLLALGKTRLLLLRRLCGSSLVTYIIYFRNKTHFNRRSPVWNPSYVFTITFPSFLIISYQHQKSRKNSSNDQNANSSHCSETSRRHATVWKRQVHQGYFWKEHEINEKCLKLTEQTRWWKSNRTNKVVEE